MRTLVGLDALTPAEGGLALAIGTFDGLHVGHRALIGRAAEIAQANGWATGVLTWDRHPAATLRPDKVPPLLAGPERKVELIESLGVDLLVVLPFDEHLSKLSAETFAEVVLGPAALGADHVCVGHGWRFGHKAAGDVALLRKLGLELGFEVDELGLVMVEGEPASSSRIRGAIATGDVALARVLLGRPFDIDGRVVHGEHRGKTLGMPTANLGVEPGLAVPARGIYACRARVEGTWYPAAVSVGVNPTFGGDPDSSPVRIEAFVLDLDADLYGKTLRLEFHERLREERRFERVEDLVVQMQRDVEAVRALFPGPG